MNVAIYSPNWIGDAVLALPFVNACRELHRDARLTVIAKEWVAAVYEQHPSIDHLVSLPADRLRGFAATTLTGWNLRREKFDKIYLLTDSLRSAYIAWLGGIAQRTGYSGQARSIFLSRAVRPPRALEQRSLRYFQLLSAAPDSALHPGPGITFNDEEQDWARGELRMMNLEKPLAVLPGSAAPARRVPADKWRSFLMPFAEAGYQLLMIGGAHDAALADSIVSMLTAGTAVSVTGRQSLRQSLALLGQCAGALATDSGLGQAAANLGLPTVSIFGSENPDITRPLGQRAAIVRESVHCSPCRRNQCHNKEEPLLCLRSIEDASMMEVYEQL